MTDRYHTDRTTRSDGGAPEGSDRGSGGDGTRDHDRRQGEPTRRNGGVIARNRETIEPGSPRAEHVLFVLLGVVVTIATIAHGVGFL